VRRRRSIQRGYLKRGNNAISLICCAGFQVLIIARRERPKVFAQSFTFLAAGFLFGLVRGAGYENAGRLGALATAEIIRHIGPR
jgi:hypothetical protein